jgi:protein-S-isoprenylcysteine O-methyltransferase Ste14
MLPLLWRSFASMSAVTRQRHFGAALVNSEGSILGESPSFRNSVNRVVGYRNPRLKKLRRPSRGISIDYVNLMARPSPPGTKQHTEHDNNWLPAVASPAVGTAFFALWFWLLLSWLHFRIDTAGAARWRWIAALPSVFGFAVAFRCVWDFGWTGHGTPAPMIPPKKLVVVGFYRYVRNPMYLGFITGWIGLWIVFGQANLVAFAIAFAVVLGVALFVVLYEEPTLRRKFGAEYEEYCRNVPRWIPRQDPWNP